MRPTLLVVWRRGLNVGLGSPALAYEGSPAAHPVGENQPPKHAWTPAPHGKRPTDSERPEWTSWAGWKEGERTREAREDSQGLKATGTSGSDWSEERNDWDKCLMVILNILRPASLLITLCRVRKTKIECLWTSTHKMGDLLPKHRLKYNKHLKISKTFPFVRTLQCQQCYIQKSYFVSK